MPISLKSQKMLWGRAAARCSMPECRIDLYHDETETDDPTLIGENCHIVAESDDGPRPDPTMPLEKRNSYSNLILLCRNHHKIIDAQENEYTISRLLQIKEEHEKWVIEQLGFDSSKQRDEMLYADLIQTWEHLAHLDDWLAWSSHVLSSGQPRMRIEVEKDLSCLRGWMLNRIWPGRYPTLEDSFINFRLVLQDFHEAFRKHSKSHNENWLITDKFYKISEYDPKLYGQLAQQYDFHVDLVEDLMLELTRAANLVCDRIRQYISSSYRIKEGRLVVQSGPYEDFSFKESVAQYSQAERSNKFPYPGLDAFFMEREKRDMYFGTGYGP